jgi:DNA sulfur modification protein DndD
MKIEKLSIENFGIIHDAKFDFVGSSGNLVFINGLNGRGKTTLQSAIRWCFFGDEPQSTTKFASRYAINKLKEGESITVQATAEISLDRQGERAFIERTQMFTRQDNGVPKKLGSASLVVKTKSNDAAALTDVTINPELWIAEHFPKRLINFFLFDGELMTNFFKTNVKIEIESAIREIAGVDLFEGISRNLENIEGQLNRKISKLTGKKSEEIEQARQKESLIRESVIEELKTTNDNLEITEKRLKDIYQQLSESRETEAMATKLKDIDSGIAGLEVSQKQSESEFNLKLISCGTMSLMSSSFQELSSQVDKAIAEERFPPSFEPERIRELLERGECICGCSLTPGDERYDSLNKLIEKHAVSSDVGKILDNTSREIEKLRIKLHGDWKEIQLINAQITSLSEEKNKLLQERDKLTVKLQGSDITSIRALANEKERLELYANQLRRIKAEFLVEFTNSDSKFQKLDAEFALFTKGNLEAEGLRAQAEFAREVSQSAKQIHGIAITQVREQLQKAIEEKFALVKSGKFRTSITEDFEVLTLNEDGSIVDLSEGESMAKAYIFSLALRDVINLGFPLIVDTPFGRLSGDFRGWLSEVLSSFLLKEVKKKNRQIIFLMTDTEYTPYTKARFEKATPLEFYLASELGSETEKSIVGRGIDPEWFKHDYWKDWAK